MSSFPRPRTRSCACTSSSSISPRRCACCTTRRRARCLSAPSTTASTTRWWSRRRPSNTVAKCVLGISDTLATNVFAQAGKCRVPSIVFACDTAPELETMAPHGLVKVYPRRIDLENTEKAEEFRADEGGRVAGRPEDGDPQAPSRTGSLRARPRRTAQPWLSGWSFITGHLARARLEKLLAGLGETEFAWEVIDIGVKVAALMTEEIIKRRLKLPEGIDRVILPGRFRGDVERLSAAFRHPVPARPGRDRRPAAFPRPGRPAARPFPPRHQDLRRDRRCAGAVDRGIGRAGARACRGRRRRHRHRLPARNAVPAARRGRADAEGRRLCRQRQLRQPGRAQDRRLGRCGLPAQPRREDAAARIRPQGDAGADSVGSRRSRFARARHRGGPKSRHLLHRRSGARPDPFRLRALDRPLHRGAPPLA